MGGLTSKTFKLRKKDDKKDTEEDKHKSVSHVSLCIFFFFFFFFTFNIKTEMVVRPLSVLPVRSQLFTT